MNLNLDDATPTNRTMHITNSNTNSDIILLASEALRINWQKCVKIPLEDSEFKDIINKPQQDQLIVLRDSNTSKNIYITADTVTSYEGCSTETIPLNTLRDEIKLSEDFELWPNIPWPLICYRSSRTQIKVCIYLTNYTFIFKNPKLHIDALPLHLPPMFVDVVMDNVYTPKDMRLAVVLDLPPDTQTTKLYKLPLPNIWDSGQVCWGQSTADVPLGDIKSRTMAQTIGWALNRFFNSTFNLDLLTKYTAAHQSIALDKVLENHPDIQAVISDACKNTSAQLHQYIDVIGRLAVPDGWYSCNFNPMSVDAATWINKHR